VIGHPLVTPILPHLSWDLGKYILCDNKAQRMFDKMKEVMSTCPVLALLDFTQPFVLKCDASSEGIVVLMQHSHLIAYESIKLTNSEKLYSIYNKEMLAIMHALVKFRQCLVGGKFVVKTYHNNMRHFLGQQNLNERQQKWVCKLQAYFFGIEYVKGKKNAIAYVLSR
jgi:hypothetical protein